MKVKLTQALVDKAVLSEGMDEDSLNDVGIPGFKLRLRKGGSKGYFFQWRLGARQGKTPIGAASAISLAEARAIAARHYAGLKAGVIPAEAKAEAVARARETFGGCLPAYLAWKQTDVKPSSYEAIARHLKQATPLRRLPLASIDQRAVALLLVETTATRGPAAANRLRDSLSGYFDWSVKQGIATTNVAALTNKNREALSRGRVLSDAELRAVWTATEGEGQHNVIVRLVVLLGCRRDEIGSLRWSEIDLDKGEIMVPAERTKNSRSLVIPLAPVVAAMLEDLSPRPEREFVFGEGKGGFSGWSKSKARLDARAKIETPWTLHDLRRTLSTRMHEIGIQPHIVEAVLNHASGHKGGVAGRYNHALYANEKRRALNLWGEHVLEVVEDREHKIVPLRA
jgi:integrase